MCTGHVYWHEGTFPPLAVHLSHSAQTFALFQYRHHAVQCSSKGDLLTLKMEFKQYAYPVVLLDLYVNSQSKIIHILDESQDNQVFPSWLNESIQSRILNRLDEPDEPERWIWLCYNLDGFVTEYRFGFKHVPFGMYPLHEPFADEMRRRILAWTGCDVDIPTS